MIKDMWDFLFLALPWCIGWAVIVSSFGMVALLILVPAFRNEMFGITNDPDWD